MSKVHDLIKVERKKRGIPRFYWSREMARLAQSQAEYCAKVGRLVHSNRFAFQGGENLAQGGKKFTPRNIVDCWLNSKQGHREYLLNPKVKKAGVGIAKCNGKTFVAWAFSSDSPAYPDCPYYKRPMEDTANKLGRRFLKSRLRRLQRWNKVRRTAMLKIPLRLFLGFIGILGIVLGAHGVYVYFSRLELFLGGEASKLFLELDVPIRLQGAVLWMSGKGVQSWVIPAVILVVGIVIYQWSGISHLIASFLGKLKLW